jgi:hypothetical protein
LRTHFYILTFIIYFISSCKEEVTYKPTSLDGLRYVEDDGEKLHRTIISKKIVLDQIGKKKVEEIRFNVGFVSALDFIKHKQVKIDKNDLPNLKNESVAIFEMNLIHFSRSIIEARRNPLDPDQTMQYLVGGIIKDFSVIQNNKEYIPNGHQVENSHINKNRIKLFLFFKGVNIHKKIRFIYHDRLFGSGMLNFGLNKEK